MKKYEVIFDMVYELMGEISFSVLFIILVITFPVWVIPYIVIKKIQEKKEFDARVAVATRELNRQRGETE